ncbi:unnamed protein product [Toxocara canis]|uniref:Uncharacterized protein n=1 Tax=Toxocara canis TaxID=6265 RepID=A0A183TW08_TOXCA|nr:unnamed protein product [Toxocara canis]
MLRQAARLYPYTVEQKIATTAAAKMLRQERSNKNPFNDFNLFEQHKTMVMVLERIACNTLKDTTTPNDDIVASVCCERFSSSTSLLSVASLVKWYANDEDARSHKEAKMEMFSGDHKDHNFSDNSEPQCSGQ